MPRNVEFALLVAATAEDVDCKSCNEINGGGDEGGEPDTDSTSELSLLSDLYGEHDEESTYNGREKTIVI